METYLINKREEQWNNLSRLMKIARSEQSFYSNLKASRKRANLIGKLFLKAFSKESIVAWRSPFVPTEILYAMDIIPFFVEGACAMLANSQLSTKLLNSSESNYYSSDGCSFLRCAVGAMIEDCFPTPDFLVCTSYYCDGDPKTFYNLSQKYSRDYFFLDIPYDYEDDNAINYLADQIEVVMKAIGKKVGKRVNVDKLAETIDLSNQAREYFIKAMELRKHMPAPILGREAIDYAGIVAHTWGTKEIIDIYKLLYEELQERVEKNIGILSKEKYRILWRHLRPYYSDSIFDYLENKCRAVIAFEEINFVTWDKMDPNNPYRSLARKILANPGVGNIEHWINTTLAYIDNYKIDGVIEFAQWGCRHLSSAGQIFKQILQKKGIPLLILDGDCVDGRNRFEGQIRTRIDAFLEVLDKKE